MIFGFWKRHSGLKKSKQLWRNAAPGGDSGASNGEILAGKKLVEVGPSTWVNWGIGVKNMLKRMDFFF